MYTYTPKRDNKTVIVICSLLFVTAAVCYILSADFIGLPYPFIWQIMTILILVAGVQIATRYFVKSYTYVLSEGSTDTFTDEFNRIARLEENGGVWFKIYEVSGKKSHAVGGFPVTGVVELAHGGAKALKRYGEAKHSFNFCNNLFPKEACYTALVILNGEMISISFEADGTVLNYFKRGKKNDNEEAV